MSKTSKDYMNWIVLIGIVLFLLEISFFNSNIFFPLLIGAGLVYIGRGRIYRFSGKLFFWGGVIFLLMTILQMVTFRLLLLAILIYFVYQFLQSKKKPSIIEPELTETKTITQPKEVLIRKTPLFQNDLFSSKKTPEHIYEWNDVNIQGIYGDTIIDLSNTVLPKSESTILIRQFIGNMTILVPYDTEITINHSVLAGGLTVFDHQEGKSLNQTFIYQTEGYENAEQKVKLVTSTMIGNLEVKRI